MRGFSSGALVLLLYLYATSFRHVRSSWMTSPQDGSRYFQYHKHFCKKWNDILTTFHHEFRIINNICCRFLVTITVFRIHLQIYNKSTRYQMAQRTIDFFSYKNCEIFDNLNPASFTSACYRVRAFSWPRLEYDRVSHFLIAFNEKSIIRQLSILFWNSLRIQYVTYRAGVVSKSGNETQIRIFSLQGY